MGFTREGRIAPLNTNIVYDTGIIEYKAPADVTPNYTNIQFVYITRCKSMHCDVIVAMVTCGNSAVSFLAYNMLSGRVWSFISLANWFP